MNSLRKVCVLLVMIALLIQMAWLPKSTSAADNKQNSPQDKLIQELEALSPGKVQLSTDARTGKIRFFGRQDSQNSNLPPSPLNKANANPEDTARGFMAKYGSLFGLTDQAQELRTTEVRTIDKSPSQTLIPLPPNSRSVVRFKQTYKGVPVLGGELVVQIAPDGNDILSATGEILPDISLETTPAISESNAQQAALEAVSRSYAIETGQLAASTPELMIYNPAILGLQQDIDLLVWSLEATTLDMLPIRELVLVDAHTGMIPLHFNQVDTVKQREVFDAGCSATLPGTSVRSEGDGATGDIDQDNAYDYSGLTYDFYASEHGRDSIDGDGMWIRSTVHYDKDGVGCNYQNAFWDLNLKQMVYGTGFASALDVVGHELTHGVTQYESGLFYYMQSGAINEALSDIWGEFIELTYLPGQPSERWKIGENLPIGAIRNMSNPPAFGDPDRMTSSLYIGNTWWDNGGVHKNSGVANKTAYLMVDGSVNEPLGVFNGYTITGMGISKTADLWYEAQTNLLTSASDYADLYDALMQAAFNLGYSAADIQTVRDAVNATEMNQQPTDPLERATEASICPSSPPYNIWFDDMENLAGGKWVSGSYAGANLWLYYTSGYATSGIYSLYGEDPPYPPYTPAALPPSDSFRAMSSGVTLPANAYLHFRHAYDFDSDTSAPTSGITYDGGVVEYSTNGGTTWTDAAPLFTINGYNKVINSSGNPLNGRSAFGYISNGYISSQADLSSLAGQSVRFRFRIGTNATNSHQGFGWVIDDVRIYVCGQETLTSCNAAGIETNTFQPGETVYVKGGGLAPNRTYKLWIQHNPVPDGAVLVAAGDPSSSQETISTDSSGHFGPTAIWTISGTPATTSREYDIVADKQADGSNTGKFNNSSDGIDASSGIGFAVPAYAAVNISANLQGSSRPDPAGWLLPVTIKFFTHGANVLTDSPVYAFNGTTNRTTSGATYQTTPIMPGTYDVTMVSDHTLLNVKRNVGIAALATPSDVNMGTLLEGNANGDNLINISDFGMLAVAFMKTQDQPGYDARADFDRNGVVNISDFGLLAVNFMKASPVVVLP